MSLSLLLLPLALAQTPELERAWQREYAFLHAEAEALRARLAETEREDDKRLAEADARLDRLQARLLALSEEANRAEDRRAEVERSNEQGEEARELLRSTLGQAATTLGRAELAPSDQASHAELAAAMPVLFEQAAADLDAAARLRIRDGAWFDTKGEARQGRILELGEIARFGLDAQGGALVPAGEGRLRLATGEPASTATAAALALARGEPVKALPFHGYESLERRVEARPEKTLADTVRAGGLVGLVILALGAGAVVMALLRLVSILRAGAGAQALVERVVERIEAGEPREGLELARRQGGAAGRILARVLELALAGAAPREELEARAAEALLREQPALERFAAGLRVSAAVAPLLGLLGTVTGMIGTFALITEYGTGDPKMLSSGISEALVTTQFGLVVAIPALLVGNGLRTRAEAVLDLLETAALATINALQPDRARDEEDRAIA